ncbi:MAG: hypothetical protein AAGJ70_00690 [Pseudomonadota bacterium]
MTVHAGATRAIFRSAAALFVTLGGVTTAAASDEWQTITTAKPAPTIHDHQRFGLGAEIPSDVLFAEPSLKGTGKEKPRVSVRRASPKTTKSGPVLKGWDNLEVEVAGQKSLRVGDALRPGCLDSHAILAAMTEAGWSEFAKQDTRTRSIAFNARRRDGRIKRVQVDRCSGEIIHVSAAYTQ